MTLVGDTGTGAALRPGRQAGPAPTWTAVDHPDPSIAICEREAIGTTVRVATNVPAALASARSGVDSLLHRLDLVASRFRPDSEVERLNRRGAGVYLLGPRLRELVAVALGAARWTGGLVDPTVGSVLLELGYDRDFSHVASDSGDPVPPAAPVAGWRRIQLEGSLLTMPEGVRIDLGATGKAFGADLAAALAFERGGSGVLVSLGGDIALAGDVPDRGWMIVVEEAPGTGPAVPTQQVRLASGGIATSSTTRRRWRRDGRELHHLIDPRTGAPAAGRWRTATVAASSCAEANAASTAAVVGGDEGLDWLAGTGLPARLVSREGSVVTIGGWPRTEGATVPEVVPSGMAPLAPLVAPRTTSWLLP